MQMLTHLVTDCCTMQRLQSSQQYSLLTSGCLSRPCGTSLRKTRESKILLSVNLLLSNDCSDSTTSDFCLQEKVSSHSKVLFRCENQQATVCLKSSVVATKELSTDAVLAPVIS